MSAPTFKTFDYNSFADLSQVFDNRKGQVVPPQVIAPAQQPVFARVTLYATTAIRARLAHSKFIDVNAFLPTVKPLFLTLSAPKKAPVIAAPAITAPVASIPANSNVAADIAPAAQAEEPKKVRTTLKLKTKIELPSLQPLSRRSTAEDLAAAFKTEMALMEKKAAVEPISKLEDAFTKRRRHPLSDKPWSELLAEVETPKQSKASPDLAALFKAEMKAFMAEQERMGVTLAETPAPVTFKPADKTMSQQPQRRMSLAA